MGEFVLPSKTESGRIGGVGGSVTRVMECGEGWLWYWDGECDWLGCCPVTDCKYKKIRIKKIKK